MRHVSGRGVVSDSSGQRRNRSGARNANTGCKDESRDCNRGRQSNHCFSSYGWIPLCQTHNPEASSPFHAAAISKTIMNKSSDFFVQRNEQTVIF
jgi:hypothetical protein